MKIDFIGAPGAGKSTLKHAVVDFFNRRGIHANLVKEAGKESVQSTIPGKLVNLAAPNSLRAPLLWRVFYPLSIASRVPFMLRNRQLMRMVVQTQYGRPQEADIHQRKVFSRFMELVGFYEYLDKHNNHGDVLVFDEGFIHRVILLFASEVEVPNRETIENYIDLIPRSDLIVYTYAPPDVCKKRILERGLWGWSHEKTDEEIAKFVDHAIATVEMAVDCLREKNWPVVTIDNQNDGSDQAEEELKNLLESFFPQAVSYPAPMPLGIYRR